MIAKHKWAVKTQVSIVSLQFKFGETQNDCLTQIVVYLAGVELKNLAPAWVDWIKFLILRECKKSECKIWTFWKISLPEFFCLSFLKH